jgi:hypothetical protein
VIDSNYLFDGVVRIHDAYSPTVSAARYSNISVHVWRFPAGKIATPATTGTAGATAKIAPAAATTPTEKPAMRAEALEPGTLAEIAADGDCLRIREAAGVASRQVACPGTGAQVRILEGTAEKDGYRWQLLATGSSVGWAADMYLEPVSGTVTAESVNADPVPASAEPAAAVAPPAPKIIGGDAPPPAGGYALFVFSGGTYEDLLAVSGCEAGTATFWATSAGGAMLWYLPGVTVAAVNAAWNDVFGGEIAPSTALMGRCI